MRANDRPPAQDYIHRIGRTARAGRAGISITFVTQYDVELYQRIEALIGKKMDLYACEETRVLQLHERVCEAQRTAAIKMRSEEQLGRRGHASRGGHNNKRRRKHR